MDEANNATTRGTTLRFTLKEYRLDKVTPAAGATTTSTLWGLGCITFSKQRLTSGAGRRPRGSTAPP
eukprot:6801861-Pyramimonas_sp.AAC.1